VAITPLTTFTGGVLGDPITTTSEPVFNAKTGTVVYGPAIPGVAGASMRINSVFGDMNLSLGGRTTARIGYWLYVNGGTQSAAWAHCLWRAGTTNRFDMTMLFSTPGRLRGRGDNASATTLVGDVTGYDLSTAQPGPVYIEVRWEQGVGQTWYIWLPGNTSATPSQTITGAFTGTGVDNVRFGNVTGTSGLDVLFGGLVISDGEQIRQGPVVGTVDWAHNGWASSDSQFSVKAKTTGATLVALEHSVNADFSSSTTSAPVAPDAQGYVTLLSGTVTQQRYWRVIVDGQVSTVTGRSRPRSSITGTVTFGWGSCFYTGAPQAVFDLIMARSPHFFVLVGDYGYTFISSQPAGSVSPTDPAAIRGYREGVLQAAGSRALTAQVPISYTYSDGDGAGGNADGTTGGHANGSIQAVYRQMYEHGTLPLAGSGARSWIIKVGTREVRMIQTDETVQASPKGDTDDAAKTKLGAAQKAWLKAEMLAAKAANQGVLWMGDGPWGEPANNTGTGNTWARYNTERVELGTFITSNGIKVARLHGDTHTLFYDDGTNNPWGGFPTASAAPMHETAQPYGGTVSGGKWPTTTTNASRQYGIATLTDNGSGVTVGLKGYSSTIADPTEVERFSASILFNFPAPTGPTSSRDATFFRANSGLTPAGLFSDDDHERAWYALQGTTGSLADTEYSYLKGKYPGVGGRSLADLRVEAYGKVN
jgi:hypothetical protein